MKEENRGHSIKKKIALTMGIVSLVSILILALVSVSGLSQMRDQTLKINSDMGAQAAEDSRSILESEATDQLSAMAAAKAETVDACLDSIITQVNVLANTATDLYAHPGNYDRIPIYPPKAENQGIFTSQIVYAERTTPASVADEVGLLGNMASQMNGVSEYLAGAGTTQIGTTSGTIIWQRLVRLSMINMKY